MRVWRVLGSGSQTKAEGLLVCLTQNCYFVSEVYPSKRNANCRLFIRITGVRITNLGSAETDANGYAAQRLFLKD